MGKTKRNKPTFEAKMLKARDRVARTKEQFDRAVEQHDAMLAAHKEKAQAMIDEAASFEPNELETTEE